MRQTAVYICGSMLYDHLSFATIAKTCNVRPLYLAEFFRSATAVCNRHERRSEPLINALQSP